MLMFLVVAANAAESPQSQPPAAFFREIDQRLMDAWATGDRRTWQEYLDDAAIYVDEDGSVFSKRELLTHVAPLPKGYTTRFTVTDHRTVMHDRQAVTTHLDIENLEVFGQSITPRLRATESWHLTNAGWRITSVQVLALPSDPRFQPLSSKELDQYAGSYALAAGRIITLTPVGDTLKMMPSGVMLFSETRDVFFIKGRPRERKIFLRSKDGSITGFADRREGHELLWSRIAP
jgi:hypothetical protein